VAKKSLMYSLFCSIYSICGGWELVEVYVGGGSWLKTSCGGVGWNHQNTGI